MPFITQQERRQITLGWPTQSVGQSCYMHYTRMVRDWEDNPRWSEAHKIATELFGDEEKTAKMLAFMVFFNLHIMPYEEQKRKENGDI